VGNFTILVALALVDFCGCSTSHAGSGKSGLVAFEVGKKMERQFVGRALGLAEAVYVPLVGAGIASVTL
jgi:hypothetical protein